MPRDLQTIKDEYTRICAEYGDMTFQVESLNKKIGWIKMRVKDLLSEHKEAIEHERSKAEGSRVSSEEPKEVIG